jgi:hypothetical protein
MFQRYNLALSIIAKQRELINAIRKKQDTKQLEKGIELMIEKLKEESELTEEMILGSENPGG